MNAGRDLPPIEEKEAKKRMLILTMIGIIVNETPASLDQFFVQDTTRKDGSPCRDYTTTLKEWPKGQHQPQVRITFTTPTDDGWNLYPTGTHTFQFIVTVH